MVLAAAAAFAGASVQSATGFGFALILGPALFAVLGPEQAVSALLVLGLALNVLVLSDSRRARVRWRALVPALLAAVPGLVAGALILTALPKPVLQATVGAAVIVAALVQLRSRRPVAEPHEPSLGGACAVGLASGALTTSTSVSGPPLVLWFEAQGLRPAEMRTSLAICFLALNLAGGAALIAAGGTGALAGAELLLPLLGLVVAGYLTGARAFRRLDPGRFRLVVFGLVIVAGAASLAAGLASA
jgi:uncharacterized membrane protein YfcA